MFGKKRVQQRNMKDLKIFSEMLVSIVEKCIPKFSTKKELNLKFPRQMYKKKKSIRLRRKALRGFNKKRTTFNLLESKQL